MTKVWVDTDLVEGAAARSAGTQTGIGRAWASLGSGLAGSHGMGGNPAKDRSAAQFVPAYTRAVQAAWQGFAALHRSVGDMSKGLAQTAKNHADADLRSSIGEGFSVVPRQPSFLESALGQVVSGPLNIAAPPSAAGPGKEPPKSLLATLTGIELIDISEYWPTADPIALHQAGVAWKSAHDSLINLRSGLVNEVNQVTRHSDAPDIDAFGYFWKKLYAPGAQNTVMEGLPQLCLNIAKACADYAAGVGEGQMRVNGIAGNPIAAIAEVAALRAALAAAAGKLLQAVSVITTGALAGHLVTSVTVGAANAPNVRILQAELDDSVLREWRNLSDDPPDTEDLEKEVRKIAEELGYTEEEINEAIHGVKAHGDWRGIGGNRNPDVLVDLGTGEVYPQTPSGVGEDSIGNIYDHLPKKR